MTDDDPRTIVHQAIHELLDDGEIAVHWCLTIDVAGPDDLRYLSHRAGGGIDGTDSPTMWGALGMLSASTDIARDQLRSNTSDTDEDDEPEDDED